MAYDNKNATHTLKKYLRPIEAWALAFGAAFMILFGYNYHYMMNRYPGEGGTYSFTKIVFGYDHGFLSAWFLRMTYIAMIWANFTALALVPWAFVGFESLSHSVGEFKFPVKRSLLIMSLAVEKALAEEHNKAKTFFLSNMSHDL